MSGDALLLGLDVGTASSKGVLTTLTGEVVRTHVVPHGVSNPHPGQYEQDADAVWWADVVTLCRELLQGVAERVAGVAVSAIGPCLLPLDGDGRPLRPGILYGLDTRATRQITALEREIPPGDLLAFSGMTLSSQAVGPKIRWLRETGTGRVGTHPHPHHRQQLPRVPPDGTARHEPPRGEPLHAAVRSRHRRLGRALRGARRPSGCCPAPRGVTNGPGTSRRKRPP